MEGLVDVRGRQWIHKLGKIVRLSVPIGECSGGQARGWRTRQEVWFTLDSVLYGLGVS
jgi:hypothetical protein